MQGISRLRLWIYPWSLKSGYGSELQDREQNLGHPLFLKGGKGVSVQRSKELRKFMFQVRSEF